MGDTEARWQNVTLAMWLRRCDVCEDVSDRICFFHASASPVALSGGKGENKSGTSFPESPGKFEHSWKDLRL